MTELSEVLKTIEKLDRTLTQARTVLHDAKEVPAEGTLILPNPQNIRDFYSDYVLFKTAEMSATKDTLTLRTHTQKLEISMVGVLELLSDKFKVPVVRTPEQKITSKPPFVTDMDEIINHKMGWIKAEFNKIMAVDDPRINRLCQDYYRVQSYPLIVRLNYLEWERQFISYHLKQTEVRLEDKKSLELREVRKQYIYRLDKEKSALNLRLSQMQNELLRLRTVNDRLDSFYQNASTDNIGLKQEIEVLYEKLKGKDALATSQGEELAAAKVEIEVLKHRLEKYEFAEDWKPDFASTMEAPVFYNQKNNEILKFPCSIEMFKKTYSLASTDGTNRTYSREDREEFKIPHSLALKIPILIQQKPVTNARKDVSKEKNELPKNFQKVIDVLNSSGAPLSIPEISEKTGIAESNLRTRYLNSLIEDGSVVEEERDEMKLFYLVN